MLEKLAGATARDVTQLSSIAKVPKAIDFGSVQKQELESGGIAAESGRLTAHRHSLHSFQKME